MKVVFLLLILFVGIMTGVFSVLYMPYHGYSEFQRNGLAGRLIKIERPSQELLSASNVERYELERFDSDALWMSLKFVNAHIPAPISHPSFITVPNVSYMNKMTKASVDYLDNGNKLLLSFKPLETKGVNLALPTDLLFSLPLVKKYIYKKGRVRIWQDLFTKDLQVANIKASNITKLLKRFSPLELSYYLYLYKLRERIFPGDIAKVLLVSNYHILFEKKIPKDAPYKSLRVGSYLKDGKLYRYELKTFSETSQARLLESRVIKNISFDGPSSKEDAYGIYAKFKTLPYSKKVSFDGMGLLYFAWSHDMENKGFFREMIQMLEKSKDTKIKNHLFKFYKFSHKKWGTNFSTFRANLKESEIVKLKKQIELEKQKELDALESMEINGINEINKDQIESYLLKKGKSDLKKSSGTLIEN